MIDESDSDYFLPPDLATALDGKTFLDLYRELEKYKAPETKLEILNKPLTSLSKYRVNKIVSENKKNTYDLVQGTFYISDDYQCEYTSESLDLLNLLKSSGFGQFYVPSSIYKKIQSDLAQRNFHINMILSCESVFSEDNNHDIDKALFTPLHCKYLFLVISPTPTHNLYVFPEMVTEDIDASDLVAFHKNELSITKSEDIFKKIQSNKYVVVERENFIDLNHFYLSSEIASKKTTTELAKFKFSTLGDISTEYNDGIWYHLGKLLGYYKNHISGRTFDRDDCIARMADHEKSSDGRFNEEDGEQRSLIADFFRHFRSAIELNPTNYKLPEYLERYSTLVEFLIDYSYEHKPNEILVESISNHTRSGYFSNLAEVSDGEYQIVVSIDRDIATPEYVLLFLSTKLGKLNTQLAAWGSDNIDSWKDIEIPIPTLSEQADIISAMNKIDSLSEKIKNRRDALINNPTTAIEIDSSLDEWLAKLDMLSESDQIRHIISQGESDSIEFKESFSLDVRRTNNDKSYTPQKETLIEHAVLKTIVGFFNTNGGTLLIGVSDSGGLLGVDNEVNTFHKKNIDKFLLHFKNLFKSRIGPSFYTFYRSSVITINNKNILRVECSPSPTACYLDNKDFYVRTNPATDKLEGPELVEYIQNHWK